MFENFKSKVKDNRFFLLVIFFSLLPLVFIFSTSDLYHSHDGLVHLPRIAAFYKALSDGHFPVRWAGDLNYGYGMPLFNFIYQLPYLVSSVFIFLGFGLVNSFKLSISLSFILSGIFMFLAAKEFFEDDKKAFFVSIFYQFASFRLVELLIRGSFGEVYTYTFLPLVLYGLLKLFKSSKTFPIGFFFLMSLAVAFLVLSHNSVSFLFFVSLISFLIIFSKSKKNLILGGSSVLVGLALSSFYWVPAIFEHKFTYGDLYMKDSYLSYFPPLINFFIPNITNSSSLQTHGINVQIGFFHSIGVLLAIPLLFNKKINSKHKKLFLYGFILLVTSVFFMQKTSLFFWENISFLRQFQFPWRFLSLAVFSSSLLSVSYLNFSFFSQKKLYWSIILFVVFSTAYFWKPNLGFDKINESYYLNFPLNTTYYGETDIIWSEGPARSYPKKRVEIIGGEGQILDLKKKTTFHSFKVNAKTNVQIVDKTQYFPGWRVFIDGKPSRIQFQDPNWRGQITFYVPLGDHQVNLIFQESKIRLFSDIVSAISFMALISGFIYFKFKTA